jgi:hypothetical protein
MDTLGEHNEQADKVKGQLLELMQGLDAYVALTALTYTMSSVIVGINGIDNVERDEQLCDIADTSLRHCVEYAREYLKNVITN